MRENLVMTSTFTLPTPVLTDWRRETRKLFLSLLLQKALEMKGYSLEDFFSTTVIEL